jgi:amino acid transporter
MAVLCGFANYGEVLLTPLGLHLSPIFFYVLCGGLAWYVAYRDIQLSTVVMLTLEVASVSLIILVGGMVLSKKGYVIDTAQLTLHGAQPGGIVGGLVLAVFSYVGFERATTLGEEAQHPLCSIPRAVLISTGMSGMFFILLSYIEVLGFQGLPTAFHEVDAPLNVLAQAAGLGFCGLLISVGAMISFFACTLASINAGARIFFAMGRHGIVSRRVGQAHRTHATPHIAVTLAAILTCLPPAAITLCGVRVLDGFGYFGTLATYGFLVTYILISIAAPRYLAREHQLRLQDVLVAIAAVLFMVIPAVGSIGLPTGLGVLSALFPVPAAPYHVFPYVFLLYLLVGMGWLLIVRWRSPECMAAMERDIEASHSRFSDMHKV